jgi:hypothetical protein
MRTFLATLDDRQQRLYAGLEARIRGRGGERLLAQITGLDEVAIIAGQRELEQAAGLPTAPTAEEPETTAAIKSSKPYWRKACYPGPVQYRPFPPSDSEGEQDRA